MAYKSNASPSYGNCVHRGISRLQAEKLLLDAKQEGSFLIRESETVAGAYTLCLLVEGRVHQYRIFSDNEGLLSVQSEAGVKCRKFPDLPSLVQQYVQRGQKNGLAGPLMHPVMVEELEDEIDDEGDKVEEADTSNVLYEIIPPSEENGATNNDEGDEENTPFDECVSRHFSLRFSQLNLSGCDGPFITSLKQYVESDAAKDAAVAAGEGTDMKYLKRLLDKSVYDLDRHVESLMVKIDACRQLFGPITTAPLVKSDKNGQQTAEKIDLQEVCDRVSRCKAAVKNLERKAEMKYRELSSSWNSGGITTEEASPPRGQRMKPIIPPICFEAKVLTISQAKRIKLTVDIQAGKLLAVKPNKEVLNESNVFTHDKIHQLIKSTSNNCRLDVKIAGCKKKTYIFEDVRQRENFCQVIQQMKNMYSLNADVMQISIFVGTWNMANEVPNYNLSPWLKSEGVGKKRNSGLCMLPHDIYVVGVQESSMSEKEWINKLKSLLYENFVEDFFLVSSASLWGLRVVVLARQLHFNKFTHIQQSFVKTGIANTLGNKGAVGVTFCFDGTSFCFICCHLTSGSEKLTRRNQNARDILKGINLGPKNSGFYDASNHFHHIFFFGDLNYRLDDLDSEEIIRRVKSSTTYSALLEYDQLTRVRNRKEAFVGFSEEDITFPPTYRFQKQTRDRYVWEKIKTTGKRINAPSWCDRILWRSYPEVVIDNTSYGSVDNICSSDHKPVFSSFDVSILNQFTSSKGGNAPSGGMKIIFEEINAEVKTTKQEKFQVQFYSPCLENTVLSKQNMQFSNVKDGYCCPKWTAAQLVQLQPILDDWDYLEDQHLLLAVKTSDGLESYGECVLALKSALSANARPFHAVLTHLGEETGSIRGLMHLKSNDESGVVINRLKGRKAQELIYMDTDFTESVSEPSYMQNIIYADFADLAASSTTNADRAKSFPSKFSVAVNPENLHYTSGAMYASDPKAVDPKNSQYTSGAMYDSDPRAADPKILQYTSGAMYDSDPRAADPKNLQYTSGAMYDSDHRAVDPKNSQYTSGAMYASDPRAAPPLRNTVLNSSPGAPSVESLHSQSDNSRVLNLYEEASPAIPPRRNRPSTMHVSTASKDISMEVGVVQPPRAKFKPVVPEKNVSMLSRTSVAVVPQALESSPMQPPNLSSHGGMPVYLGLSDMAPISKPHPVAMDNGANDDDKLYESYDPIRIPASIKEWLTDLNLPQYAQMFLDAGWDHVKFIDGMTIEDLSDIGVTDNDHQTRILHSIASLKSLF